MKNLFNKIFGTTEVPEQNKKEFDGEVDFETAIKATGFGNFNILLLVISFPTCMASLFETTTMSYVFPAAQCDLNLSLADKGNLNAITYAGTITSAFLWGFLFDTFGRRRLLIIGFIFDGIFVILSGFSQNITFLMVMKFMGGFIINGPFAALTAYLSEVHSVKYRSIIPLVTGMCYAVSGITLPLLASFILRMDFEWVLANHLVIHPWSVFLWLNSIPSLLSGLIFVFLPESPKFLMSMGRNEEALKVFQKIYSLNSGKPYESYPVKILAVEKPVNNEEISTKSTLRQGCSQILPLFSPPFLSIFVLVCCLQVCITMSQNTLRLWLPQMFQAITDYKIEHNQTSSTLCEMLSAIHPKVEDTCSVNLDNNEVYVNSMIVAATAVFAYVLAGSLVNKLGQNLLMTIVSFIAGSFAIGIYFSPNSLLAIIFISTFSSASSIGTNVMLVIIVNLFPTTLRTMTVSLAMMSGRAAAMVGNIVFPYLLEMGCMPPFFAIAGLGFASSILSLLLPKKNKQFI